MEKCTYMFDLSIWRVWANQFAGGSLPGIGSAVTTHLIFTRDPCLARLSQPAVTSSLSAVNKYFRVARTHHEYAKYTFECDQKTQLSKHDHRIT